MTDSWWTSTERVAVPAGRTAKGAARLPPSKSLTHRAFAMALVAKGPIVVERPLESDDTRLFLAALEAMGCAVERGEGRVRIARPESFAAGARLECGNAGTVFRLLVALAATVPGEWEIDGSERLRQRPIGPLAEALAALGAQLEFRGSKGCAPLVVRGGRLGGGRVRLDAGESSQYLSALLFAGQRATAPIEIEVAKLASAPYVRLTTDVLGRYGGRVEHPLPDLWITKPAEPRGATIPVEADWSAAAYPAAAAALTGGDILLEGAPWRTEQGDRRFLELLRGMGAEVVSEGSGVRVRGTGPLVALRADLSDLPDQVPTLAALAPFARGTTVIENVPHLRIKESDRLAAMAAELRRAGAEVTELPDGLVIPGVWAEAAPPAAPVEIDPHDDHRIAMAMALVGLRRPALTIRDPGCVAKSWPSFWSELARWLGEAASAGGLP